MPDFLASLRSAATTFVADRAQAKEVSQSNTNIRQTPDYRRAAETRFGEVAPLAQPIGADPAVEAIRRSRASDLLTADLEENRTGVDLTRDLSLDVASGLSTGVLNLGALAASANAKGINAFGGNAYDYGVPIARFAQKTGQFLNSLKSQEAQDAAQAYAASSSVITDENRIEADRRIAEGANPILTGAGRVFSDVVDTTGNIVQSPQALSSTAAQGVGSLLIGGPVAKGVSAFVSTGAKALAFEGLMNPALATVVAQSVEHAAMSGTIGAMEAGGAYSQAATTITDMSHADLMENSPQYAKLIQSGVSEAEAKNRVASQAGTIAATIQAPIAIATGALVAKFEAHPFAGRTTREALQNLGKETLEEGVQSFSGQASTNLGVRSVDQTTDLLKDVGSSTAEGAIGGFGTAGLFAGPNLAAGAVETVPGTVKGIGAGIQERGRQIREKNVVTSEAVAQTVKAAAQPPAPSTDPELEANRGVITELAQQFHFDPTTYQPKSAGESRLMTQFEPTEQYDIWDVIDRGSKMISNPDVPNQEKTDVALMMFDLYQNVTDNSIDQVVELQGKATPGGVLAAEVSRIIDAQEALTNNPLVRKALMEGLDATPAVEVNQLDLDTPEGQQAARKVVAQAVMSPDTVSPDVIENLQQRVQNKPEALSANLLKSLRSTAALTQTVKSLQADAERMNVRTPSLAEVANEAQMYDDENSGVTGKSVRGHYQTIDGLLKRNDTVGAKEALTKFQSFAQSMANKLEAINASYTSRTNRVNEEKTYSAYSQNNGWHDRKVTIRSQVPSSVAFGQQAGVDATFVVDSFNKFAEQHPELGVKPVVRESLHPDLTAGPAKTVAEQTLKVRDKAQRVEQTPKKQEEVPAEAVTETVTPPEAKIEPDKVVETVSRITPKQATQLSNSGLNSRIEAIQDRKVLKEAQPSDERTLEVLTAERDAREEALLT